MEPGNLIDFDNQEPQAVPVKFRGTSYVLREPAAGVGTHFKNLKARAAIRDSEGSYMSPGDVHTSELYLVGACLYPVSSNGEAQPIGQEIVTKWPSRVTSRLFDMLIDMSPDLGGAWTETSLVETIATLQKRLQVMRATSPKKSSPPGGDS
jgi:hypothetical protein